MLSSHKLKDRPDDFFCSDWLNTGRVAAGAASVSECRQRRGPIHSKNAAAEAQTASLTPATPEVAACTQQEGMMTLVQDGVLKVLKRVTDMMQVKAVASK